MLRKLVFPCITLFWVTMNVLLWQAEYGADGKEGSRIDTSPVWEKILTAPDASELQVIHTNQMLGYLRWEVIPDEEFFDGEGQPEGRVKTVRGYTLRLDGSVNLPKWSSRLRISFRAVLDAGHNWKSLEATLRLPPSEWVFQSKSAKGTLEISHRGVLGKWKRTLSFDQLGDPVALAESMGGPILGPMIAGATGNPTRSWESASNLGINLQWKASTDWIRIGGNARARAYRLETKLPGEHSIRVVVSRVGEILRVELPGQLILQNEVFSVPPHSQQ